MIKPIGVFCQEKKEVFFSFARPGARTDAEGSCAYSAGAHKRRPYTANVAARSGTAN